MKDSSCLAITANFPNHELLFFGSATLPPFIPGEGNVKMRKVTTSLDCGVVEEIHDISKKGKMLPYT